MEFIQRSFTQYPLEVIIILVFTPFLFLLIYNQRTLKNNQLTRQLESILNRKKNQKTMDKLIDRTNQYLGSKGDKIQTKLERSDILFKKQEYITLMVIGIIGGAGIGFLGFPLRSVFLAPFGFINVYIVKIVMARLASGIVFGAIGYFLPEIWIKYLTIQRRKLLGNQIEDALLNMADSLRSGADIHASIRLTGQELKYPMGDEFSRTYQEMSTGKTIIQALDDLKERVNLKDFTMAINAVQIQFETGASLEPLLRDMVKIIADRKVLKKEIDKAVTESKTTGIVLMSAPILFTVVFSRMNAEGYAAMFDSTIGIVMVGVGVVAYVIGSGLILKIIHDISKIS